MKLSAKEIAEKIIQLGELRAFAKDDNKFLETPTKSIIDYARQEIKKRDEQWESLIYPNDNLLKLLTELPEPKFE